MRNNSIELLLISTISQANVGQKIRLKDIIRLAIPVTPRP